MLAAVEKAGVIHAYGENMIHAPDFREILDIVAAGTIGKPLWVRGREAHFGPHSPWFWKKAESGGGALIDMGCHLIAVFNALLGESPTSVLCHAPTLHHDTDCEDIAIALLRYPGGTLGQCEASWIQRGGMQVTLEISRLGGDGHLRPLGALAADQGVRAQPGAALRLARRSSTTAAGCSRPSTNTGATATTTRSATSSSASAPARAEGELRRRRRRSTASWTPPTRRREPAPGSRSGAERRMAASPTAQGLSRSRRRCSSSSRRR